MRILLVTNNFPNPLQPTRGVFNLEMARGLNASHPVRVVSPVSWRDDWALGRNRSLRGVCDTAGIPVEYPRYYYTPGVLRGRYGAFYWLSAAAAVRRALREHKPEVVIGYWAHPDGEAAVRAARLAGVPAVVMVGGSDVLVLARDPGRRRHVARVLNAADAVITVSGDLRAEVAALGVAADRIHVVERGVDPKKFAPRDRSIARRALGLPEGRVLLWVGRMVPVKGLDVLADAAARLRARGAEFHLCLVGDGPLRAAVQADVAARGLTGVVRFCGTCDHDRLNDWYSAADVTVLPSRSEGVPNVLRESLACGTPFVASAVGGVPALAGDDPALKLVPPDDPEALADSVEEALNRAQRPRRPAGADLEGSTRALAEALAHIRSRHRVASKATAIH